jgi:acyl transferase domain-containing protein
VTNYGPRETCVDDVQNGDAEAASSPKVFVWSSFDEAGIARLTNQYQEFLNRVEVPTSSDAVNLLDGLAYTLSNRREALPWKSFMVAKDLDDLRTNLITEASSAVRSSIAPTLLFVFTGQGAVWHAMGRELQAYPLYSASLKRAETVLHDLGCTWSLTGSI